MLKPHSAPTYTAIGFLYALMGNLEEAITYFHKSLALNRDCIVTSTILKTCIEDFIDRGTAIDNIYPRTTDHKHPHKVPKLNNQFPTIVEEDIPVGTAMPLLTPMNKVATVPIKLTATKLKFDEEDASGASSSRGRYVNTDVSMDM